MQLQQRSANNRFPAAHIDHVIEDLQMKVHEYADYDFAQTSIR